MSIIPGSIPITGFIAPTDTSDKYPVTDAIYGIDGLRNVPTYYDMYNIPIERRRSGMIVGVQSDNTYWKLLPSTGSNIWNLGSASNWERFDVFGDDLINKYRILPHEKVVVPTYSQYWVYGDLTIEGELENYGQVVIANGGLILSGGTFGGMTGSLIFVSLDSGVVSYLTSSTIGFDFYGSTLSANILPSSITTSLLSTTGVGATPGYLLSNDGLGNFTWINPDIISLSASNGLLIESGDIILGGTLSRDTIIDGNGFIFGFVTCSGFGVIANTGIGGIQFESKEFLVMHSDNYLYLSFSESSISDSSGSGYGLVYNDDYSGTFITNSLVSKAYVDNQVITGLTAGTGLFKSGNVFGVSYSQVATQLAGDGLSANLDKIDINVSNGLTVSGDYIQISPSIAGTGLTFSSGVLSVISGNAQPIYQTGLTTSVSTGETGILLSHTPNSYSRIQVFVNGQLQSLGDGVLTKDCHFGTTFSAISLSSLSSGDQLVWNDTNAGFTLSPSDIIDIIYES